VDLKERGLQRKRERERERSVEEDQMESREGGVRER
jgi:hypothetical protein